jgi:hypothetical protein
MMKAKLLYLNKKNAFSCVIGIIAVIIAATVQAQNYPFTNLPTNVNATLDVKTSSHEPFRNALLGYNIFGFDSSTEKDFIHQFDPRTIRFPHGLWANWYDWRIDKTRLFGVEEFSYLFQKTSTKTTKVDFANSLPSAENATRKIGIDGLEELNKERKNSKYKSGYDVVWTFNMSADGTDFTQSPETVAFYDNLISRGFEVKIVELGNECFYPGQRSSIIPNTSDFILRAKSMSKALKAKDPNIQISIPLLRRSSPPNPDWNADLTQDTTYYDAVTVHTYIGSDPDNAANTDNAYSTALTARKSLATSTNTFVRPFSKDKPIWLTEWGVKSGGPNAASALGMADCYLFMAENQNIYQRANWFSVNGKLNSFVAWEKNEKDNSNRSKIKYPLEKTLYGATYEILRSVFEESSLLSSTMATADLVEAVKAVSARAVTKNGKTTIIVLNMTDKIVPFTLKIDGTVYNDKFTHNAMSFDNVSQQRNIPIDENPLRKIKKGSGDITLPPLSINTIVLGK